MSYVCGCAKRHDLTKEMRAEISRGQEIRLKCANCSWDVVVGVSAWDYGAQGSHANWVYSFPALEMRDLERLAKLSAFREPGVPILMECGHVADFMNGSTYCCSKCAYNKLGTPGDTEAAWAVKVLH